MDNRDKNQYFDVSSLVNYVQDYSVTLSQALRSVPAARLTEALRALRRADRLFVCGNGGSAAIADHWACDMFRGLQGSAPPSVVSLTAHAGLMTAIANDVSYAAVFAEQLKLHRLSHRDCLVCVSASGNSANVVRAAEYAKGVHASVVGFTGFGGGRLLELADVAVHVGVNNYGVVEDAHSALMHGLSQFWFAQSRKPVESGAV